ncbi:hypothetical protein D3C83_215480 [compost metagenome]
MLIFDGMASSVFFRMLRMRLLAAASASASGSFAKACTAFRRLSKSGSVGGSTEATASNCREVTPWSE